MNNKEFIEYIQELENYYGQQLNDTERDIWFNNLQFMSIERFNYIISEIFKINKFMPKLSEILEIHKSIPYDKEEQEIKQHCDKCNDTGYIIYTKIVEGMPYQYSAVCDCNRQNRYDGSKITDLRAKSNYYIPTVNEIGLKVENTKPTKQQLLDSMNKLKNSSIIPENIKDILRKKYASM